MDDPLLDGGPLPGLRKAWDIIGLSAMTLTAAAVALVTFALDLSPAWGLLAFLPAPLLLRHSRLAFAHHRWQRHPGRGMVVTRGAWWRREVWVPITRLQHLDVERGPIDRQLGLAKLLLHTAGSHEFRISIKGLSPETAIALRDSLLEEVLAQAGNRTPQG